MDNINLQLEQDVISTFRNIEQVSSIYVDENRFVLFLKGERYDDALMDVLLDCERNLHQRYESHPLAFYHHPVSSREFVSNAARCIYETPTATT